MGKYDPLWRLLRDKRGTATRVVLSFEELDALVGGLPPSARKYREWWSNEDPRETVHVQAKAWMEAGWCVAEVSLSEERVTFERL